MVVCASASTCTAAGAGAADSSLAGGANAVHGVPCNQVSPIEGRPFGSQFFGVW